MKKKISNTAEFIATDIRLVALAKQKLAPNKKLESERRKATKPESKLAKEDLDILDIPLG